MRNWKNWLFPILTCLTVAALAVLPLRLSAIQDRELTGTVHAEDLPENTNFPFKPPEMPGRIWLLVQNQEMPENITIMSQELEGAERDQAMKQLREALTALGELLSPEAAEVLMEADGHSWDWFRYFLRDQTDLASTSFIEASTYDKVRHCNLNAVLDVESGQILCLTFRSINGLPCEVSTPELGKAILDRLGLEYTVEEVSEDIVYFRLAECKSLFWITMSPKELDFNFTLDWSAMDEEIAERYGHEPVDAASMQIR